MRRVWRGAVPVVLLAAGVLFVAGAASARGTDLRGDDTRTSLADVIGEREHELTRATARLSGLRDEVDALTARAGADDARVRQARAAGQQLEAAAGLRPVAGPGLSVTLDDAPRDLVPPEGTSANDLVVHQQDLQAVINALWAGGAEAMRVMDQRVIVTSAPRCVGNTLILQGRTYSPPYTVTAIGDPRRLRAALDASEGVRLYREYVDLVGLGYDVRGHASLRLPAYEGSIELAHASAP